LKADTITINSTSGFYILRTNSIRYSNFWPVNFLFSGLKSLERWDTIGSAGSNSDRYLFKKRSN
jgi:hypothetical protein